MNDQTDELSQDELTEDTPLQAAVWLVEDMGLRMPPIPDIYADKIREFSLGLVFGTDDVLATLVTPYDLETRLSSQSWPVPGVAFGFVPVGTGGVWFYTLVSEQIIIQISLRIKFTSKDATEFGKGQISLAHYLLERYLSQDLDYARAISPFPKSDDAPRQVVCYSNDLGPTIETVASWSGPLQLSDFRHQAMVFTAKPAAAPAEDLLIFK